MCGKWERERGYRFEKGKAVIDLDGGKAKVIDLVSFDFKADLSFLPCAPSRVPETVEAFFIDNFGGQDAVEDRVERGV